MLVASQAADDGEVRRCYVAISAAIPLLTVLPGVDGEVLAIMVERGGCPGSLGVAP